jgi:hypothetical protein
MELNWINIKEELPKEEKSYLVYIIYRNGVKRIRTKRFYMPGAWSKGYFSKGDVANGAIITHWAEVQPPN